MNPPVISASLFLRVFPRKKACTMESPALGGFNFLLGMDHLRKRGKDLIFWVPVFHAFFGAKELPEN